MFTSNMQVPHADTSYYFCDWYWTTVWISLVNSNQSLGSYKLYDYSISLKLIKGNFCTCEENVMWHVWWLIKAHLDRFTQLKNHFSRLAGLKCFGNLSLMKPWHFNEIVLQTVTLYQPDGDIDEILNRRWTLF